MLAVIGSTLNFLFRIAPRLGGKWTFALFCRSRMSKVREAERETLAQAVVETITVDGKRIATYRWGNGENPVLLIHGWESRGSRYARFVRALREQGLTAIAFDAPGHGDSEGQATIVANTAVVQRLHEQYGPFEAIIAHSFGVPCAFLAARRGVRTGRIVAISGPCDFSYLTETFCRQLGLTRALHDDLCRRTEAFFQPELSIWDRFSVSHQPAEINVPILVIHDEADDIVMLAQAHKIAEAYGDRARLVITKGLGHRRILSDREVIATAMSFLGEEERQAMAG